MFPLQSVHSFTNHLLSTLVHQQGTWGHESLPSWGLHSSGEGQQKANTGTDEKRRSETRQALKERKENSGVESDRGESGTVWWLGSVLCGEDI